MPRISIIATLAPLMMMCTSAAATAQPLAAAGYAAAGSSALCPVIESTAQTNGLPVEFFVRVIWQESRFQPDAVGPLTRSGQRAQGIAQFMPETAAERGLSEPFNPVDALPKSGAFLAQLRNEFGNLGLAAAAYDAGPQRVHDFLSGLRGLPVETRHYVLAVTGQAIEEWTKPAARASEAAAAPPSDKPTSRCPSLMAALTRADPTDAASARRQPAVPSWCGGLRHPNASICGAVHLAAPTARAPSRVNVWGREPAVRTSSR